MKITIKPIDIHENPKNEVTTSKIFQKRAIYDEKTNRWFFDENGIFSDKIFGKFNTCFCGKLTKPGYCEECHCRVITRKNMPNFYIKFDFDLPNEVLNFEGLPENTNTQIIESLMNYDGFLYDGEYVEYDVESTKGTDYDTSKVLIGKDAVLSLGIPEEWYNKNIRNKISIPHTVYRKVTVYHNPSTHRDEIVMGDLNKAYIALIRAKEEYLAYIDYADVNIFVELTIKMRAVVAIKVLNQALFQILAKNHRNIIDNELKGQPETGMIRAVMTNNFGLDEDVVMIGSYFASTLYPVLTEKHTINNVLDIDGLNEELKNEEYYVLFNRQPTIGAKSIITMKPIFSSKEAEQFVIQANPIVYDGLAADVDGDALNIIALYSKEANEEAKKLLASKNYLEGANGKIRNGILEEFAYVATVIGEDING